MLRSRLWLFSGFAFFIDLEKVSTKSKGGTHFLVMLLTDFFSSAAAFSHKKLSLSRSGEELLSKHWIFLTYEALPLWIQVSLVGQAALHDIGAVVGAGFDGGQAATVRAVNQLHQGPQTLWTQRNLESVQSETSGVGNGRKDIYKVFIGCCCPKHFLMKWQFCFVRPLFLWCCTLRWQ